MLRSEVVTRRRWMTEQYFLDVLGVNEIALLFGAALLTAVLVNRARLRPQALTARALLPLGLLGLLPLPPLVASVSDKPAHYSDARLFLTFLKIGAVLYGSGYV